MNFCLKNADVFNVKADGLLYWLCFRELKQLLLFLLLLITFILNLLSITTAFIERSLYDTYYMACVQIHWS